MSLSMSALMSVNTALAIAFRGISSSEMPYAIMASFTSPLTCTGNARSESVHSLLYVKLSLMCPECFC